jgi:hypothetical protein
MANVLNERDPLGTSSDMKIVDLLPPLSQTQQGHSHTLT